MDRTATVADVRTVDGMWRLTTSDNARMLAFPHTAEASLIACLRVGQKISIRTTRKGDRITHLETIGTDR